MDCESLIGLILLGMVMFRPTFHEKWDEILCTKSAADKEQLHWNYRSIALELQVNYAEIGPQ